MDTLKRSVVVGAVAAVALGAVVAAPSAMAGEVPPAVTGWQNGTVTCANGVVSVFPVVITNATTVSRTGSYTVPDAIGGAVQVTSSPSQIDCGNSTGGSNLFGGSVDFTVAPGSTTVLWMGLGSSRNQETGSHTIALGGLPSGTRGQSWYDLAVSLNGAGTFSGGSSFSSMQVQYEDTGGVDSATSGQDLFNLVACDSTAAGVYPTTNILTPYSASWTTGSTYGANQAVCAGWFPEGPFQSFSASPQSTFVLQAAQSYGSGQYLAMAGSGTQAITSVLVRWTGPPANLGPGGPTLTSEVTLSSTPGAAGGWWVQDPITNQWSLVGLTPPAAIAGGQYTSVTPFINGIPIGSTSD